MANEFIVRKGLIIYGSTGSTLSNTTLTINDDGVVKNSLVNDLQVFNSVSGLTSSLSNSLSVISTDINSKENTINKQDSLVTDGTGIKFPTVDAINNANFISNNNVSNILKEEFTYISGTQSFTLAATYSQVYMVSVQGQGALSTSQYTLTAPNIVTVLDTLDTNDYVTILYSTAPVAVQPYYTQGQSDTIYVPKSTTIAINGVTQSLNTNISFTISKRLYFYEFSFAGGNFSNANGYWFYLNNYSGKYNQSYGVLSTLTPTNNFAAFNQYFGYNERVPFDCKIKNVYIHVANNGATYNLDLAILNFKLASTFGSGTGSGVTDRVIIARETNSIGGGGAINKAMADINVDNDYILTKGSFCRLFINTGGSTNAPIQNPLITIELEEI